MLVCVDVLHLSWILYAGVCRGVAFIRILYAGVCRGVAFIMDNICWCV